MSKTVIVVMACLLASMALAAPARAADEIKIGHFGSISGGTATFGVSTDEGVKLAADEINAKGGLLGKQVRIITEDDQSKPEEAVTVVQKLINQDKVVALIGE